MFIIVPIFNIPDSRAAYVKVPKHPPRNPLSDQSLRPKSPTQQCPYRVAVNPLLLGWFAGLLDISPWCMGPNNLLIRKHTHKRTLGCLMINDS